MKELHSPGLICPHSLPCPICPLWRGVMVAPLGLPSLLVPTGLSPWRSFQEPEGGLKGQSRCLISRSSPAVNMRYDQNSEVFKRNSQVFKRNCYTKRHIAMKLPLKSSPLLQTPIPCFLPPSEAFVKVLFPECLHRCDQKYSEFCSECRPVERQLIETWQCVLTYLTCRIQHHVTFGSSPKSK